MFCRRVRRLREIRGAKGVLCKRGTAFASSSARGRDNCTNQHIRKIRELNFGNLRVAMMYVRGTENATVETRALGLLKRSFAPWLRPSQEDRVHRAVAGHYQHPGIRSHDRAPGARAQLVAANAFTRAAAASSAAAAAAAAGGGGIRASAASSASPTITRVIKAPPNLRQIHC